MLETYVRTITNLLNLCKMNYMSNALGWRVSKITYHFNFFVSNNIKTVLQKKYIDMELK